MAVRRRDPEERDVEPAPVHGAGDAADERALRIAREDGEREEARASRRRERVVGEAGRERGDVALGGRRLDGERHVRAHGAACFAVAVRTEQTSAASVIA